MMSLVLNNRALKFLLKDFIYVIIATKSLY